MCDVPIKIVEVVVFVNSSLSPPVIAPKIRKFPVRAVLPSVKNPVVELSNKYTSLVSTTPFILSAFTIWLKVVSPSMLLVDNELPNEIVPVELLNNEIGLG